MGFKLPVWDDPGTDYSDPINGSFGPRTGDNLHRFDMRFRPSVYATRIDAMPLDGRSAAWVTSLNAGITGSRAQSAPTLWRNFAYQDTGYQPFVVSYPYTLRIVGVGADSAGQVTSHPERFMQQGVGYPVGNPQNSNSAWYDDGHGVPACPAELSGGTVHTDAHVICYCAETGELWELYGYNWHSGVPTAYMARYYNLARAFFPDGAGNSADESGQIIYPMLPKYSEIVAGIMPHAIRFNAPKNAISQQAIWPARNGAKGGMNDPFSLTYPPMGAWCRLKASYDISSYRSDTQVYLTALKHFGAILSDVGESWSMVGTANEQWPSAMLAELRLVPTSQMEFVDAGFMSTSTLAAAGDIP